MMNTKCFQCKKDLLIFPSRFKNARIHFCNKSCHRSYKNTVNNPSKERDLSGENNPMYGKHPVAWNKGLKGEESHNWRGGVSKRKDGYMRINIDGERHLLHRYLLKDKVKEGNVVHHKDNNPSNNKISNLEVLQNQSEHARKHSLTRRASNSSKG